MSSIDETKIKVSKLSPKAGDVIVLAADTLIPPDDLNHYFDCFNKWLKDELPGVNGLLLFGDKQTIQCLTEEDMLKLGYVKIDKPIIKEGG